MVLGHRIESHRYWDVVTLWSQERLEHEELVARALATAVVRDGLMLHSTDPKWLKANEGTFELRGTPYVGYSPLGVGEVMVLRAEALEHLLGVVHTARPPSRAALHQEFIFRSDFARWLVWSGESWPKFWFPQGQEQVRL